MFDVRAGVIKAATSKLGMFCCIGSNVLRGLGHATAGLKVEDLCRPVNNIPGIPNDHSDQLFGGKKPSLWGPGQLPLPQM